MKERLFKLFSAYLAERSLLHSDNWLLFQALKEDTLSGLIFARTNFRKVKKIIFREDLFLQMDPFQIFHKDLFSWIKNIRTIKRSLKQAVFQKKQKKLFILTIG